MITILYEDDRILAVEKPEGLATIPERFHSHCLLETLQKSRNDKLWTVHRLDKEVSGGVVFAKDAEMHRHLNLLFEARGVKKTYKAVVHGSVSPFEGTIDRPIRKFGSGRMGVDTRRGKPSKTSYHVVKKSRDMTMLEVHPESGRRHQIRVHLYSIGHPIVGDVLYGERKLQEIYPRLMLHAESIRFPDLSGQMHTIRSPLPEIFQHFARTGRFSDEV